MINPDFDYEIKQTYKVTDKVTDVKKANIKAWMIYERPLISRKITFPDGSEIDYDDDYDVGKLSHFEIEQILLYRHGYSNTIIEE